MADLDLFVKENKKVLEKIEKGLESYERLLNKKIYELVYNEGKFGHNIGRVI